MEDTPPITSVTPTDGMSDNRDDPEEPQQEPKESKKKR